MTAAKSPRLNYALWWFIVVVSAVLVTLLTLPLLGRSVVIFGVVAGACWAGVFAAAVMLTRVMNRQDVTAASDDEGDAAQPVEPSSD